MSDKPRGMKPSISRRTVLRGTGVAVALPLLESLLPRQARAQTAVKRFAALFFPNGSTQNQDWQLTGTGTTYTMGTAHDSLLPLKARLSMFKNLNGPFGGAPDHSRGTASFLTAANITSKDTAEVAISIDQAIVDYVQPDTALRSLHLGPPPYAGGPPSDTGWSAGYNVNISWRSATAPNSPLETAQTAFDQVFVPTGDPTADALAQQRYERKQSVLDHVIGQVGKIQPRLGAVDGAKLDEYLTSLRDVESRLQAPTAMATGCGQQTGPDTGLTFPEHTQAMLDVLVLAFQCDATRFATYSMDYGFGNQSLAFLGYSYKHHNISHSGTTPELLAAHKAAVQYYVQQLAYFIGKLDAVSEGGGTVLDNSLIYFGSDVGDAWSHSHQNLTTIVAGGAAGALSPGRLIDAQGADYASVLLALAHAMDAPLPSFATASTPFVGL